MVHEKIETFKRFWKGEGPCLILIPPPEPAPYDAHDYPTLFHHPQYMWEAEMHRAKAVLDWPTDGIPTVRPSLGVVFVPSMTGQGYKLRAGQMPWHGEPLSREQIRKSAEIDVAATELMQLAEEFYRIHHQKNHAPIVAYHADTQGVFDVAHLVYGDQIFYDLANENEHPWIRELLEICLALYIKATDHLKKMLSENTSEMIHGHGTSQGVYFPHAGVRMSEDTPTLVSPRMIEQFILPVIERGAEVFGGAFVHYCGFHLELFEQLCHSNLVKAIDLGNPEMYDLQWLLERCAETGTVFHSRVAELPGEDWRMYLRRIAKIINDTDARCILRPSIYPKTKAECAEMRSLWHELTS
ncbi:hypothetical protein JXJ21_12750 [candidate division KSB1 bacterium]|nr:hypothetical protein [candidate division KSB1 bacterium]